MRQITEVIMNNWSLIVALISIVVVISAAVYHFTQLPSGTQVEKIKKCLLGWVIAAEKDLGGGTGKVKLSVVYGWFVKAFPTLKNFISFDTFSEWVDEALIEMRKMLEENKQLKTVVEGIQLECDTLKEIDD